MYFGLQGSNVGRYISGKNLIWMAMSCRKGVQLKVFLPHHTPKYFFPVIMAFYST